jgi:hypothetical protein
VASQRYRGDITLLTALTEPVTASLDIYFYSSLYTVNSEIHDSPMFLAYSYAIDLERSFGDAKYGRNKCCHADRLT